MNKPPVRPNGARVTVRDIARVVGVSPSTVSRVLSNGSRSEFISEETRRKIHEAASQLGYRPNPLARALKGGHSNLIGLIAREIADPFFSQLIQELSNCARANGYQIVLGYAQSDPDEALKMTNVLDLRQIDGVLVVGDLKDDEWALAKMLESNPAVVALCRGPSPTSLYTINPDNAAGIQMLCDHLVGLGHRQIGFLDGGWLGDIQERREAFLQVMQTLKLAVYPEWIPKTADGLAGGYQAMQVMLSAPGRPTAVIAADDTMAIGALKAVLDVGLRVPQDISIAGFDDIEIASYVHPALTTIRQPVDQMAAQAINMLISLIQTPLSASAPQPQQTMLRVAPCLIVRMSTGPCVEA